MHGQALSLRRLLPPAAVAAVVLTTPAVGGAHPSHGAAALRARDAAIAAKSRAAVLGLYSLDRRLGAAQARLAQLDLRGETLRAERRDLEHALRIAKRGTRIAQDRLAARLRLLYEQGDVEPIEILFGATSLDEAMASIDSLTQSTAGDEAVLREVLAAKRQLTDARRRLVARQDELAAALRDAQATAGSLAAARDARAAYISSLATERRLTHRAIERAVAEARAAAERSARIAAAQPPVAQPPAAQPPAARPPATAPPVVHGAGTLTVTATGYSLGGTTATGLPVGWGVAAVDPSVIPLGTHMSVPGYGEAVAADTGGAVGGTTIDLWFPTPAQANAWGRRTVTITLH